MPPSKQRRVCAMPIRNSGFFVQSAGRGGFFLQDGAGRDGAELLVPLDGPPYGIAHHVLDTSSDPPVWRYVNTFGAELGPVDAVSLIRSNFGDPGNLEVAARAGDRLALFWRPAELGATWSSAYPLTSGVTGAPALIQGTWGHRGCFELVTPISAGGLAHWVRDNDTSGLPWRGPVLIGAGVGRLDAVALVQSNLGGAGHLEVIARRGDTLMHCWCGPDRVWSEPTEILSGVSGRPALLQGRTGKRGHFELVAPLKVAGVGHWVRDNDDPALPWRGPQIFATELGRCAEVSLLQRAGGPPSRLEAVVVAGDHVAHFSRDTAGWFRRAIFSSMPPPRPTPGPTATPGGPSSIRLPEAPSMPTESAAPSSTMRQEAVFEPPTGSPPSETTPPHAAPSPSTAPATSAVPSHIAPATSATPSHTAQVTKPEPVPHVRASSPAVPSPLRAGRHAAGFRRLTDVPLSEDACYADARPFEGLVYQSPERMTALLYYPAQASGEGAAVATEAPFPVVALAHTRRLQGEGGRDDTTQDYRQLSGLMAHLARHGFVVIAPDLSWLTPEEGPVRRAAALRDALAHLRAGSRGLLLADFERVGLLGHGLGGTAALGLALDRESLFDVRAVALLAPPDAAQSGHHLAGLPPTLELRSLTDGSLPERPHASSALADTVPAPRHLVTVPGVTPYGYTTSLDLQAPSGGASALPRRAQQQIAKAYVTAFFTHYLRGEDHLAWLSGDASLTELAELELQVHVEAR
ncbi:chlorophyllase/cutinase-like alpha/beta fold protein [Chondromyces crocatus]|uniref:Uncharacterized protein n=1 Tax=Chondromyces crocatus TaxID=52 RepID=A0A0K1E792_CHOCO|nr:alpha/beta hydrolase [Chondromyces crocatus]AKT36746.1 uncharacterized protein CMC5_008670 [Chondromyces crocatus]